MATPSRSCCAQDMDSKRETRGRARHLGPAGGRAQDHVISTPSSVDHRREGAFTLKMTSGESIVAEHVIIAIGTPGQSIGRCPVGEGAVVQYTLDDPGEYVDEHIAVIGAGERGIENALGPRADPEKRNIVSIVNRSDEFDTAGPNVKALLAAEASGRVTILRETTTKEIDKGWITFETRDGELRAQCEPVIRADGLGAPPRALRRGLLRRGRGEGRSAQPGRK